ncbi:hypothetical protein NHX12_022398 [Muraenolepis orangiensis]|uniref:L-serine deaminase n=1 Tax=Muraenolepis orangiensis TaxID=630683 RepID=A0A9Q0EN53_9TELE|nr:hypothetical protein NHX12_022398 [Muraenolepis orangiensis]
MNFAAQFFYSSYLSERLERLYSPQPALTDYVENDPFWQSEEQRLGPHRRRGSCRPVGAVANGTPGRRPTLIEPERLKDFGEEELLGDISAAAFKIQSAIQKTPCTYSRMSKQYGMEIYLKKEHLHYTGSVKERGVLYLLTSLTRDQQKKGVIVATDCNFSMAVAHHAAELKIPAFAIMPSCCSAPRLRLYRDYGAVVISYGAAARDACSHARHLAKENDYLYLEDGQFGLLAGTAAALKHLNSRILVIGVEPEGYPVLFQSLKTGGPLKDMTSRPNSKLYGDLTGHSLGLHTFQLAKKHVDKVITVSEESALLAMLRFQEFEHSMVDTEGAMGLAAILAGQLPELKGKKVAVVVSSANMELDLVRQCVDRALVLDDRISKFTVELGSLPGEMAKSQVECVVETRDKTQSVQLRKTLCERYPSLRWLDR